MIIRRWLLGGMSNIKQCCDTGLGYTQVMTVGTFNPAWRARSGKVSWRQWLSPKGWRESLPGWGRQRESIWVGEGLNEIKGRGNIDCGKLQADSCLRVGLNLHGWSSRKKCGQGLGLCGFWKSCWSCEGACSSAETMAHVCCDLSRWRKLHFSRSCEQVCGMCQFLVAKSSDNKMHSKAIVIV